MGGYAIALDEIPTHLGEADIVLASGGRVYLADLVQGCSTTGIVRKIDESGASASSR